MTKGDLVELIWRDTHITDVPGWMSGEAHAVWCEDVAQTVKSCGYYISEDEYYYHLVGDMDNESAFPEYYLRPINIAKSFVKKIRVLRKAECAQT